MDPMVSRLFVELPLWLMTAAATHLVMSFGQTLMHRKLGHYRMGGRFFRNHIGFHHTYYSPEALVSRTYRGEDGNNTPFFLIPVGLVAACSYAVLPFDLFIVQLVACAASFYAHSFSTRNITSRDRASVGSRGSGGSSSFTSPITGTRTAILR
jgi:hypothetical protein